MPDERPDLTEPWYLIEDNDWLRTGLEQKLSREVTHGHALDGRLFRAIGKRDDRDDVLYLLDRGWAIVHLVGSSGPSPDPRWPTTWIFETLDELQKRIAADVDDFNLTE